MHIKLLAIGRTDRKELKDLIHVYNKRLQHYIKFDMEIIPNIKMHKNRSINQHKDAESELIIQKLKSADFVVLLDEKGKNLSSVDFSKYLQKKLNTSCKQLVFVVGGSYGFSEKLYSIANDKLALSKMTFSHQMVRLFFVEQLYRAFSILKNEPYHNQ